MIEARAVVTCTGPCQPVVLTLYAGDHTRQGAVALAPMAALQLAQDLLAAALLRIEER